jgi:hypothetical protein
MLRWHPRCVFICRCIFSKSVIHSIQDEINQETCFGWLTFFWEQGFVCKTFWRRILWIHLKYNVILWRWRSHAYCSIGICFGVLEKISYNGLISPNMLPDLSCLICCVWRILIQYTRKYLLTHSMEQSPSWEADQFSQLTKNFPAFYGTRWF